MGIVFRQSVKTTIITFLGALLGALALYFSMKFIPRQELGVRGNLINQAALATYILLLGLNNTLAVFIHRYGDHDKRRAALIGMAFVIPAASIVILSIFYWLFKAQVLLFFKPEDIPFIERYYLLLPVFILILAFQVVFENYLFSQMKVAKAVFNREILTKSLNLTLIFLFGFGYIGFDTLMFSTVLIYLIPLSVAYLFSRQTNGFRFSFQWNVFSKEEKKDVIHFTWYHLLLTISLSLTVLDVIMLPVLAPDGLSSVPVYTGAVFILAFLMIPYKSMLNASFTILTQAYRDNDLVKIKDVYTRASLNMLIASLFMFLIVACNLQNAVAILPGQYEAIAPIVLILSIGRMVEMASGMNDQVLSIANFYKINFYISALLIIVLVIFYFILIPEYGVYGAAWGTSAALVIFNIIKLFVVRKKAGLQPFSANTLKVLLAGAPAFFAGWFLPAVTNPYLDVFIRTIAIVCLYLAMLYWLRPSPDLREYIASIKKNKRLF